MGNQEMLLETCDDLYATRDEPTPAEYRRRVAMLESALMEARSFVAGIKVGATVDRRDTLLATIDRALNS